ncbi:MAG: hypothetical protein KBG73_09105, partial [Candidatus Promineofilum sp.]|nr:hypothetical protein [Promineifilum sp.]
MKRTAIRHLWLLLALLVWGAPAAAQTSAAALRIDPPTLSLIAGQTQTIAIVIQDAAEVYGIDVRASFDPALVEVVDANPARDGVQMTAGVFPQPDFVALNAADNAAGALRYVVTQVNPTQPATGGGVVFTFQVRGRANGVSPLRVDLVEMANRSGELLPVTTTDGTVTVTGGQPPAPTGVALTVPAEGGQPAVTASAATVAPAPTVAPVDPAATAPAAALPATAAAATTDPALGPTAAPPTTLTSAGGDTVPAATVASVETDAVAVAATPPAEPTGPAAAGQTATNDGAAPTAVAAAAVGDGADESNAPP